MTTQHKAHVVQPSPTPSASNQAAAAAGQLLGYGYLLMIFAIPVLVFAGLCKWVFGGKRREPLSREEELFR